MEYRYMSVDIGKMYIVGLGEGEEVVSVIKDIAYSIGSEFIMFIGIGGFERVKLGFYRGPGIYDHVELESSKPEAIEVAPIVGSVVKRSERDYHPHIHVSISYKRSGKIETISAHLLEGIVYPLMEIFIYKAEDVKIDYIRKIFPHRFQ